MDDASITRICYPYSIFTIRNNTGGQINAVRASSVIAKEIHEAALGRKVKHAVSFWIGGIQVAVIVYSDIRFVIQRLAVPGHHIPIRQRYVITVGVLHHYLDALIPGICNVNQAFLIYRDPDRFIELPRLEAGLPELSDIITIRIVYHHTLVACVGH